MTQKKIPIYYVKLCERHAVGVPKCTNPKVGDRVILVPKEDGSFDPENGIFDTLHKKDYEFLLAEIQRHPFECKARDNLN